MCRQNQSYKLGFVLFRGSVYVSFQWSLTWFNLFNQSCPARRWGIQEHFNKQDIYKSAFNQRAQSASKGKQEQASKYGGGADWINQDYIWPEKKGDVLRDFFKFSHQDYTRLEVIDA